MVAQSRMDSLEHVLSTQQGELRLQTLNRLVYENSLLNFSRAKLYADEAYALAESLDNEEAQIETMIHYAMALITMRMYEEALETLERAKALASAKNYEKLLGDVLNTEGRVFYDMNDLPRAWEKFYQASKMREKSGDIVGRAASFNNLGLIELRQGNFQKALDLFERSYEGYVKAGHMGRAGLILGNIGGLYNSVENYERALHYLERAEAIFVEHGEVYQIASNLDAQGFAYAQVGELEKGLQYAKRALIMNQNNGNASTLAGSLHNVGRIYLLMGKYDRALGYFKDATDLEERGISVQISFDLARSKAEAWSKKGDFATANSYLEAALTLKDSVDNQAKQKALQELKAKVDIERYQAEVDALTFESLTQKKYISILILVAGLITILSIGLIVSLVFLRRSRDKSEQLNKRLEAKGKVIENQNEALSKLNQEKDYFVKIVAHDIANQLANIHGLVQLMKLEQGAGKSAELDSNHLDRIGSITHNMVLMVRKILDVRNLEKARLKADFRTFDLVPLLHEVLRSYEETASRKGICLLFEAKPTRLPIESDKQFVAQAVDNLISNAIKFSPHQSEVKLSIASSDSGVEVAVFDQGPGIAAEDQDKLFMRGQKLRNSPTNGEKSNGLGLSIVKRYAEILGGSVSQQNLPERGSVFRLKLPLKSVEEEQVIEAGSPV